MRNREICKWCNRNHLNWHNVWLVSLTKNVLCIECNKKFDKWKSRRIKEIKVQENIIKCNICMRTYLFPIPFSELGIKNENFYNEQ